MKAKILDLTHNKYYGTEIEITFDEENSKTISLWFNDRNASQRQLDFFEMTQEEHLQEMYNDHFESELTYKLAKQLVDKINS